LIFVLLFWVPIAALDPILGVVLAALVAPIGAYLLAAKKMSGKIGTTEAATLWEESRAIREWSAARIDKCDEEILRLKGELDKAKARIAELEKEKRRLEQLIREREDHHDF
jgi:flagellar motility protein MotE (MotC chaperone)